MPAERPFAELMTNLAEGAPEAAAVVWERFAQRLVALAATRLPGLLRAKTDPESVVLSVFQSFFARHRQAGFQLGDWDNLWTLLTALTVRKCGHRVRHFGAARRDVRREESLIDPATPATARRSPEPSPAEALLLADTLDHVLQAVKPAQRPIVQLRLQGYAIEEISNQVGRSERTVLRVLEAVRAHLESAAAEESP